MGTFKTKGLVIKEYDIGESDKMITLLLKDRGKLSAYARGSRNPKSKFLASSQLFTYAEYVILEGKGFFSVTQAEVIESFYPIRDNFEKLCYANYLLEISNLILENMPCDEILYLLIKTLSALAKDIQTPGLAVSVFELRFCKQSGYEPETSSCAECGEVDTYFLFGHEGLICKQCYSINTSGVAVKISKATLEAVRYILFSELKDVFKFKVNNETRSDLEKVTRAYFNNHFEVKAKSLELLL